MTVYFNEFDAYPAQWLRNLFPAATIDDRSIKDVRAADTADYLRCHFFAGIGGWEYALQLAGWPADREVWTGSCPCQPFSKAGQRKGTSDSRHLWPVWYELVKECRPAIIFGEQVASPDGFEWLAGVRADLEAAEYEVGAADLCAASIGAPQIRQRIYWVAHAGGERRQQNAGSALSDEAANGRGKKGDHQPAGLSQDNACGLSDANGFRPSAGSVETRSALVSTEPSIKSSTGNSAVDRWGDLCVQCEIDGKYRRVEPSIFPLVNGLPKRVGRNRAYGNAIVPQVAARFIEAFLQTEP